MYACKNSVMPYYFFIDSDLLTAKPPERLPTTTKAPAKPKQNSGKNS